MISMTATCALRGILEFCAWGYLASEVQPGEAWPKVEIVSEVGIGQIEVGDVGSSEVEVGDFWSRVDVGESHCAEECFKWEEFEEADEDEAREEGQALLLSAVDDLTWVVHALITGLHLWCL